MSLVWPILVVVAATVIAIGAMLLVRRRAPEGSYFADGDRAAGVFGVIATGFSVLLGLHHLPRLHELRRHEAGRRDGGARRPQQFETAQFMPAAQRQELSDGLVCYARYVVHRAWPRLEAGTEGDRFNPWGVSMFRTLQQVKPNGPTEEAAFSKWLDQNSERTAARQDRIHAAQGVVPTPLWIVLFLTAGVIGLFMLFFADSGERAKTQALLIGSVVSVVAATLLLLSFLDNPYYGGVGALEPVAMKRTERHPRAGARPRRLHHPAPVQRVRRPALTDGRHHSYVEIVATVLLSLAAVATAWSGYQATRWNGEQAKAASRTNAIRVEAARAQGLSESQTQVDVATFIQWVDAYALKRTELSDFYFKRFRKEFRPAVQAWLETKPLVNPGRAADPVRDAAVQARCCGRGEAAGRRGRGLRRGRCGATSNVGRTTSSASSSSRCRSSSRG